MLQELIIETRNKVDFIDITAQVQRIVSQQAISDGICYIYCPHTTAGIVLNENWDPSVERDIAMLLDHIIPENLPYRHAEGNSPAHIKSILLGSDHFVFIEQGRLRMGRWQGVFLAEFDGPRRRTVWVRVLEDVSSA